MAVLFLLAVRSLLGQTTGGTIQFSATAYSVSEKSPNATITVVRLGDTNGTVTAHFRTENQNALANLDYVSTNGTLTLLPGQKKVTFAVAIIPDELDEPNEALTLILENVTGGLLGAQDNATLTILDDDVCASAISPTSRTHGPAAAASNIIVTATGGCPWVALENVDWIGITAGFSGTNNGEVRYSIDENTNTTSRTGKIIIAGKAFTLTQQGAPPPDVIKPVVTILTPPARARLTNTTEVIVTGKATDARGVASVEFRLENYVGTNDYQTADGTSNWTAQVSGLVLGTNTIRVRARDTTNNLSLEVARSFLSIAASTLTVTTNGAGSVTPVLNGQSLEVGRTYTLTAAPKPRNLFTGWSGDLQTTAPRFVFQMRTNLMLQANFVTNPFIAVKGSYNGLFREEVAVRHESSGFFNAITTDAGAFTAKILLAGKPVSFSGKFALDGKWTNTIPRAGTNALNVLLCLDLENGTDQITGTLSEGGNWTANLTADRAGRSGATNFNGKYTFIVPGDVDPAASPGGDSFGTVTVTGGAVRFSGMLADGTPVRQKVPLSKNGHWPLYVPLYAGNGSIFSPVTFTLDPQADDALSGSVTWTKPMLDTAKHYSNGFAIFSGAVGSRYRAPTNSTDSILRFPDGLAAFIGGNLVEPFTNHFVLTNATKVINLSNNRLVMTFVPSSGLFNGVVTDPNSTRSIPFKGAVHQKGRYGAGFFLGTDQSGRVRLEPETP
jgi:hypothetical protein